MRNTLVSRDEVRTYGFGLVAVPFDACYRNGDRLELNTAPLEPLVAELTAQWKEHRDEKRRRFPLWQHGWSPPPKMPGVVLGPSEVCTVCGRQFVVVEHPRRGAIVCSDTCSKISWQRPRADRRREARTGTKCLSCGVELDSKRSTRRYCSDRCRVAAYRQRRRGEKVARIPVLSAQKERPRWAGPEVSGRMSGEARTAAIVTESEQASSRSRPRSRQTDRKF
jgi:hypothetical protein